MTDPVYRNSLIFFAGSFLASVFGYLYHLAMGRMMSPQDYAVVAALLSIFLVLSVPTATILTVVMRYIAKYQAQNDISAIYSLQAKVARWLFLLGLIVTFGFMALSPWVSKFLHIDSIWPVILISLVFGFVFLAPVYRGILQGTQKFGSLAATMIVESAAKFFIGILFVWLGFHVLGAVAAIVIATALGLWYSWWLVSKLWRGQKITIKKVDLRGLLKYSLPVIIVLLATALLYNIDVVLVKHFFVGDESGYYAALSQLGKIIVFGTMAITGVMFPMVADKIEKREDFRPVFWKAAGLIAALCALATLIYFLFPEFVIGLLYGGEYLVVAPLLGLVAIFMALYSIANYLVTFFLSAKMYGAIYPLIIGVAAQVILLYLYHDSLQQVIWVMVLTLAGLTVALFVFYGFESARLKKSAAAVDSGAGV